jgi:RDD family
MPFAQPASASVAVAAPPVADETLESVAMMIVPSAFAYTARPGEEPSAPETTVVQLAGPASRILARIIDLGIAAIFSAPITVTLLLIAHQHDHQYVLKLDAEATTTYTTLGMDGLGIALWTGALLALMLVSILYEGNGLSRGGQTVGRRVAGVRVVRMPEGLPLGRDGVGTRRALLFWLLAILPALDVLALGGLFWGRPYRQGLHEKLTSTATVKA